MLFGTAPQVVSARVSHCSASMRSNAAQIVGAKAPGGCVPQPKSRLRSRLKGVIGCHGVLLLLPPPCGVVCVLLPRWSAYRGLGSCLVGKLQSALAAAVEAFVRSGRAGGHPTLFGALQRLLSNSLPRPCRAADGFVAREAGKDVDGRGYAAGPAFHQCRPRAHRAARRRPAPACRPAWCDRCSWR